MTIRKLPNTLKTKLRTFRVQCSHIKCFINVESPHLKFGKFCLMSVSIILEIIIALILVQEIRSQVHVSVTLLENACHKIIAFSTLLNSLDANNQLDSENGFNQPMILAHWMRGITCMVTLSEKVI